MVLLTYRRQLGRVRKSSYSNYSMYASLKTSLFLSRGIGLPTFTRATTGVVPDFEGIIKTVKTDEARFAGARRVSNLIPNTETIANTGWTNGANVTLVSSTETSPIGGGNASKISFNGGTTAANSTTILTNAPAEGGALTGRVFVASIYLKGNVGGEQLTLRLSNNGDTTATNATVTLTTSWVRYSVTHTMESTPNGLAKLHIGYQASPTNITYYAWGAMIEEVTGQANQNPSEYVSYGVLSAPYHGVNVDGVKYFDYQNGNTVSSNVITESAGALIAETTLQGYYNERACTNLALYSEDFTQAATWVSSNVTVNAGTIQGPDGKLSGTTLTATAGNATLLQTVTSANSVRNFSIYLKRKTGTGNIDLTLDNGSTWTTKTITSSWVKYDITQTLANPVFGIRIVTSGDEVYAFGGHMCTDGFACSYIKTVGASVTRNADNLSYPNTNNQNLTNNFTLLAEIIPHANGEDYGNTSSFRLFGTDDSRGATFEIRTTNPNGPYSWTVSGSSGGFYGLKDTDIDQNVRTKYAVSLSQEGSSARAIIYKDGVSQLNTTATETLSHSNNTIEVGRYGVTVTNMSIKNFKVWKKALSLNAMAGVSSL